MIKWVRLATLFGALAALLAVTCDLDPQRDLELASRALTGRDYDQALRLGGLALHLGSLGAEDQARAHRLRASAALALGNAAFAREELDQAITRLPQNPLAYFARGELRLAGNDAAGALADLDRGLALAHPGGPPWPAGLAGRLAQRGQAALALGRWDEAAAAADTALGLNPNLALGYYLQSGVLEARGQPLPALVAMERAWALAERGGFSSFFLSPQGQTWLHRLVELRMKNHVDPQKPYRGS
ncbi:MAG: hypothetical protein KQJ78_12240 [Deltaproteobacteria bacterium]|nr:hypothetical protein [Deltaproteobacteria bacterium]